MFLALAGICSVVSFVCFIIVILQLFQKKGVGMGIVGILCGLYTFIWGWQNAASLDAEGKTIGMPYAAWMKLWTVALIGSVVANVLGQS